MSGLYGTGDYIRDSYFLLDLIFNFFSRIKNSIKSLVKKVIETDPETLVFRIIENLPYGIFIFFLGFFLVVTLIRITEKDYGLKVYNLTTSSMDPVISPGSLVFSYPTERYRKGDVINFKEKSQRTDKYTGRILTHRISEVKIEDGFYVYITKGDNNEHPDPGEIRTTDITGSVFLVIPFIGYIDYLIRTIPGFIIFIAVPAYLLLKEARGYLKEEVKFG